MSSDTGRITAAITVSVDGYVAGPDDGQARGWTRASAPAGDKGVHVMGGAEVIRQAMTAGRVDDLSLVTTPVVLGRGKRLFEGFLRTVVLEHLGARQSPYATFIDYRIVR